MLERLWPAKDPLPFLVELWSADGARFDGLISQSSNGVVALGAYEAAARLYPERKVTMRRGADIIAANR